MTIRRAIADQSERLEPVVTYSRLPPEGEAARARPAADGELRLVPDRDAGPVDDFAAYEPPLIDGVRVAAVPPPPPGRVKGTLGAAPVDGMAIRPRKGGRALTIAIAIGVVAVIGGIGVLATTYGAVTTTARVDAPSVVPVLPASTVGPATAGATADATATSPGAEPIRQVPLSGQAAATPPAADATSVASADATAVAPPTPVAVPPVPQMRADHLAALAAAQAMPMTAGAAPVSAPPANDMASLPPAPAQQPLPPPPAGGTQSGFGMQASTAPAAPSGDDQSFVDRISRTLAADRNGNPTLAAPMQPASMPVAPAASALPPTLPMTGAPVVVNGEGRVYDGANSAPPPAQQAMDGDGPIPPEPVGPHARSRWWPPVPPLPIPFFAASAGN